MGKYECLSLTVIRWRSITDVRSDNVVDRFNGMDLEDHNLDRLLSDMKSRLSTLEARCFLFMIISFLINIFLFIGIYFPNEDISLLEISSRDLASVKEISIFVASTVLVGSSFLSMNTAVLSAALMKMYFPGKGRVGINASANLIPGSMFGNENMFNFHKSDMFLLSPFGFLFSLLPFVLFAFAFMYFFAGVFVQVYVIWDVIENPVLEKGFSYAVIAYAVICILCFFFMTIFHQVKLPFSKFNTKFNEYMENIGGSEYIDYCVSSVTWRRRPKLYDYLMFMILIDLAVSIVSLSVAKILWNERFVLEIFWYSLLSFVVFSVVSITIVWWLKLEKFISDNRDALDRFDTKHYNEWIVGK